MPEASIIDSGPSPEQTGQSRITVVFGHHSTEEVIPLDRSVWSPDTMRLVEEISPRPNVLAVDGLTSYPIHSWAHISFPSGDCNHFSEPGTTVHVLGADIPFRGPKDDQTAKQTWDTVFDTLERLDPLFQHPTNQNALAQQQVAKAYGIETVSAGIAGLTGGILLRVLKDVEEKRRTGINITLSTKMTRREFLKLAGITAGAVGLSLLRIPVFYQSLQPEALRQPDSLVNFIAQAMKPILFDSENIHMRNAKIGLATIDYLRHVVPDATSAIVLGNMHKIGIFPSQLAGESLQDTEHRLLASLLENVNRIVRDIRLRNPTLPSEIVSTTLKTLLADYNIYDFPQYPASNRHRNDFSWERGNRRIIPTIDRMIDILTG